MAVLETLGTATAIIGASIAAVAGTKALLNELGFDRSAIIEVVNATGEALRVDVVEPESGAFHDWPASYIEPADNLLFTMRSRHAGEGVGGHMTLVGNGFTVFVDWSNPLVGPNDIDITVTGARAGEFIHRAMVTGGATGVHLRAELGYSDVNRLEALLARQPYGGFVLDAEDEYCAPVAGHSMGFREAYRAVLDGSRVRFDIIVTDPAGSIRTGRGEVATHDGSTVSMVVNECVNGRRVGQWTNVGLAAWYGSYLFRVEVPGFEHVNGFLKEENGYREVFDDGSSVMFIAWGIPHI
ncbi:hypothetical protein [Streptomyces sp. NPDC059909]|uniref:hypothetical protein n=1 Tax=Streptomyces sp. NPDC059909 TaxID=3346998 RepID=UPI0036670183